MKLYIRNLIMTAIMPLKVFYYYFDQQILALFAYFFKDAIIDSKRTYITLEELTTIQWYFRFRSEAGSTWISFDPWWNDQPATRVRFFKDGFIKRMTNPVNY